MVYSSQFNPFRLTAEEAGGQPDYTKALQNVFSNTQNAFKTAYTPRNLAEELLKTTLANKINAPKAADAQGWYDTEKGYKQALTRQANQALNPYDKMRLQLDLSGAKDRQKAALKEEQELNESIPHIEEGLSNLDKLEDIATRKPHYFGPSARIFPKFLGGPEKRALDETVANEPEYGEWKTLMLPFVADAAQGLSHKGLALALNQAIASKADFSDYHKAAQGKLGAMREHLNPAYELALKRYKEITGREYPRKYQSKASQIGTHSNPIKMVWRNGKLVRAE